MILCPGTRNIPLISAFSSNNEYICHSYVDERSAAFFALGKALVSGHPVAIVCTSGSAVMNFAPAVSEAYYRHIPLIVISADRPEEWIDQDDSQTIRQNNVLSNIVKKSFLIQETGGRNDMRHYVWRVVNDSMICALSDTQGPVHLNVPLHMPLNGMVDYDWDSRYERIRCVTPQRLELTIIRELACRIQSTEKVLIVSGFNAPSARLTRSISRLLLLPNVSVLDENLSNLHLNAGSISPDILIDSVFDDYDYVPRILITFGGSIVSQRLKKWLRHHSASIEHWHVSPDDNVIDTYNCLRLKIPMIPEEFFPQLTASLRKNNPLSSSGYNELWKKLKSTISLQISGIVAKSSWNALTAMQRIISKLNSRTNLQVSNGMSVRYLMFIPESYDLHRVDCNRGVSGIDGSTSTAIGASAAYTGITVFMSGDMSARYDVSGIIEAIERTKNFKMVIFDNGGGNIFNVISSSQGLDFVDKYMYGMSHMSWRGLMESVGWQCFEASSFEELDSSMPLWLTRRDSPSALIVHLQCENDTAIYRQIFESVNILNGNTK